MSRVEPSREELSPRADKEKWQKKDIATIIISISALVISSLSSIVSLYKQYYDKHVDLNIKAANHENQPEGGYYYSPYVDLTIFNTGSIPIVITALSHYFVDSDQTCNERPEVNWIGFFNNNSYIVPSTVSVKPGEDATKRVYFAWHRVTYPQGIWTVSHVPCVEIGISGQQNDEIWKTITLGTVWFGAQDPMERPKTTRMVGSARFP